MALKTDIDSEVSDMEPIRCEGKYRPGTARVGEATPQSNPELFTKAECEAEVKYLLRLNKRYGTHPLRVQAYLNVMDAIKAGRYKH